MFRLSGHEGMTVLFMDIGLLLQAKPRRWKELRGSSTSLPRSTFKSRVYGGGGEACLLAFCASRLQQRAQQRLQRLQDRLEGGPAGREATTKVVRGAL